MPKIIDFPKLHSPFIRETINGEYVCTPKIDPVYEWVFNERTFAVDKIDGTNICVYIEKGNIVQISNRATEKHILSVRQTAWESFCLEGISKAIQKGWLKDAKGSVFGELIGERVNTNRHQLKGHLFVPFNYLKKHCFWKSWTQNKYPKDYESINAWFKDLPSLFNQRMKLPDIQSEGLVFYDVEGKKMAKLRRDMFDWYEGERH